MQDWLTAYKIPLGKWIARWLVWLQDAALACTAAI